MAAAGVDTPTTKAWSHAEDEVVFSEFGASVAAYISGPDWLQAISGALMMLTRDVVAL